MKKILVYGLSGTIGGVENFILNYISLLDRDKFEVHLMCYDEKPAYNDKFVEMGCTIHTLPSRRKSAIANYFAIRKLFKENDFDIFWFNVCSLSDILPLKIARLSVKKVIVHSHTSDYMSGRLNKMLHSFYRSKVHKIATDFWACSVPAARFMFSDRVMKDQNYKIINNAIKTREFAYNQDVRAVMRRELGVKDNQFTLGHVGRMHDHAKNHTFVIEIFKEIVNFEPTAILLLVGGGRLEPQIRSQVDRYDLNDNVIFLGVRSDVASLMQAMDVFVMPSVYEGFPVVGIEAQTSGLHCFFSDNITDDLAIADAHYISLNWSARKWAKEIYKYNNYERLDKSKVIEEAGYDIKSEAKKIETYLEYEKVTV